MICRVLNEPELEFGTGNHVDIRFGLMNHGPFDVTSDLAPRAIRVGIVGTPETVDGLLTWLERCRGEIAAKESKQPNLFPRFPGFSPDCGFRSTLVLDPRLHRTIPQKFFDQLRADSDALIRDSAARFHDEFTGIVENATPDVLVCALPIHLIEALDQQTGPSARSRSEPSSQLRVDFHDLLKARCMTLTRPVPVQLVTPMTYDKQKRRKQKGKPNRIRTLQDEATIAWNIHAALYYKAGGTPWRIVRDSSDLTACYIGVSFYESLDRSRLLTSIAQVFDERGDGLIVRGGRARLGKDDRTPHLGSEDSRMLLASALGKYRDVHKNFPARIVLHKTSAFNLDEAEGFSAAAAACGIDHLDLISVSTFPEGRLFRRGAYPPLRGTLLSLDDANHMLYTRGSVDFFATYPGPYVPRPLSFRVHAGDTPATRLASEILALTKLNWNDTQFDGGQPITLEAARRVGAILKYVPEGANVAPRYSYYM
jgi:hypothetical protein